MNGSANPSIDDLDVEVTLSRPAYRLGGTVVGTVRVTTAAGTNPRESLLDSSLQLSATGRCRLDPRWHNVQNYQKLHGSKPPTLRDLPEEPNTVCFWATEPAVELLELRERDYGRWEDARPKPIRLPGRQPLRKESRASIDSFVSSEPSLETQQLAFTFRIDLPRNLPHTMVATSCRYYYTVSVRVQKKKTSGSFRRREKPVWIQVPLTVLTADPNNSQPVEQSEDSSGLQAGDRIQMGTCRVMAHSSGLSSYVTATELAQWDGQLTVNRRGAALYRHVSPRDNTMSHLQTMRVADPATDQPVCVLTIIGGTLLHPGSRLILKLDFPVQTTTKNNTASSSSWLPCHQASACLQGEEMVIRRDGTQVRARSHLWDTAHEIIDPACTECTSLHLLLPVSAPCSIQTDIVSISIQCLVDLSVGIPDSGGYRNLRLEIPCKVSHSRSAWELQEEEADAPVKQELLNNNNDNVQRSDDPKDPSSFPTRDIEDELKILSLAMADRCGLRPKPPLE